MSDEGDCEAVSGPFCIHYHDPADCSEACARPGCGDPCCEHGRSECSREGCGCPEFVDVEICGDCGSEVIGHHGPCEVAP